MAGISDLGFDANKVEPSANLIDGGEYDAIITSSDRKRTNDGTGEYISLTFQICQAGKYQNRLLWHNLNIVNKNDETVTIAKGQLSAICRAVGVMTPNDTSDLHDKPMKIAVGQKKDKNTNEMKNIIRGFKPRQSGPAPVQTPTNAPSNTAVLSEQPW